MLRLGTKIIFQLSFCGTFITVNPIVNNESYTAL